MFLFVGKLLRVFLLICYLEELFVCQLGGFYLLEFTDSLPQSFVAYMHHLHDLSWCPLEPAHFRGD